MAQILFFVLAFVAGPALFWALQRPAPSLAVLRALGIAAILLVLAGIAISLAAGATEALWPLVVMLLLLWAAWIAGLATFAQAVRYRLPGPLPRRVSLIGGALVATAPWFGLAAARVIGA